MFDYALYAIAGRILIYLLQTNGITQELKRYTSEDGLLREFIECDLCVGFWVYLFLAFTLKKTIEIGVWPRFVENIVLAGTTTLVIHLFRLGWNQKFAIIEY